MKSIFKSMIGMIIIVLIFFALNDALWSVLEFLSCW